MLARGHGSATLNNEGVRKFIYQAWSSQRIKCHEGLDQDGHVEVYYVNDNELAGNHAVQVSGNLDKSLSLDCSKKGCTSSSTTLCLHKAKTSFDSGTNEPLDRQESQAWSSHEYS